VTGHRRRPALALLVVLVLVGPGGSLVLPTAAAQDGAPVPDPGGELVEVPVRVESRVGDVGTAELTELVTATLDDPRGWAAAGFRFRVDPAAPYRIVLAEPAEVDRLCQPLRTRSQVSCQNGPVVALNADRWRSGPGEWDASLEDYRRYLVNHEVGHLVGQRHPEPRCPAPGTASAVMEQQTKGLEGCRGNVWPLWWEIERAATRPAVLAPPPEWGPDPVPRNLGGAVAAPAVTTVATTAAPTSETEPGPASDPTASTTTAPAPSAAPTSDADAVLVAATGDGSDGPALPTWLSVVVGGALGAGLAALAVRRWGRRRGTRSAPAGGGPTVRGAGAETTAAWDVSVRRGRDPVDRTGDTLSVVPARWGAEAARALVAELGRELVTGPDGDRTRVLVGAAPAELAEDEGLGVVVHVPGAARVLVAGTAELVVEDEEGRSRHRRAVVDVGTDGSVRRFGVVVPPPGRAPAGTRASSVLLTRSTVASRDDALVGPGADRGGR
jgi:hypothetical protein